MRFLLLGPLVVRNGAGEQVTVPGLRLRNLLAALLVHANIPVPAAELAEMVWDGSPPPGAVGTLRSYIRRLRRAVDPGSMRVAASYPGYVIRVEQGELDVLEFEAFCRDTRTALRAGEWVKAYSTAARALELWRATPLLDVAAEALRSEIIAHLEWRRLQVLEDRFDAGLRLGRHQELIPQLLDLTVQHPLQERFHAQLVLALASTGRRAEALGAYQQARERLVGELGLEPSHELRDIHRRILADDGAAGAVTSALTDTDVAPTEPAGTAWVPPAQLPADIMDFTGRQAQAACLGNALTRYAGTGGTLAVRIAVVTGPAAAGKTALSLHVAHQIRDQFPDGQLYVRLSGASNEPTPSFQVLARLLRDLGVDSDKVPAGEEERAALYRTRLAGRRVLILLDDADNGAQVRPLLPGSASCAVVVIARSRMGYLASSGVVDLGALTAPEALELFSRIVGEARAAAEATATAEILRACAGFPLAVRICATRLVSRPQWRVATMAARLRDKRRRLDELQIGDLELRASFQLSYDGLRAGCLRVDPARVFRLLGLWPGKQIGLPAAAALTGEREEDLVGALEALIDANLLESPEPDCYQLNDLLRLFAAERAQAEETSEARLRAVPAYRRSSLPPARLPLALAYLAVRRVGPAASIGRSSTTSLRPLRASSSSCLPW